MRKLATAFAISVVVLSCGCASIVSKSTWPVAVNSNPSGIPVSIRDENGQLVHNGITPYTVMLRSSNGYFNGMDYTMEAGGSIRPLNSSINGWYFGNIIFGGLIGLLIVDPATGAMWTFPDTAFIESDASY